MKCNQIETPPHICEETHIKVRWCETSIQYMCFGTFCMLLLLSADVRSTHANMLNLGSSSDLILILVS